MKPKQIASVIGIMLLLGLGVNYVNASRADALIAEERVRLLEIERADLERQVEEALEDYEILQDSLDQAHDSIAEIREQAVETARESSVSFNTGVEALRDSLSAYEGLGAILDAIQADHVAEVEAYQVQIETLEADKALLWQRVEALDSMWVREQDLNAALRREITALNEDADAWEAVATPSMFGRIGGAVPYVLGGVAIGVLVGSGR